jgi:DNA (cytosine-5)-methyltransferase 1
VRRVAVSVWRGERVSFPGARIFDPSDPDLPDALRGAIQARQSLATAVDLFCGAGGLSLGLRQAGIRVLLGADIDPTSCETHAAALEDVTVRCDLARPEGLLRALARAGVEHVDVVAGGPPCQPFSRAGRSKIRSLAGDGHPMSDSRPQLWRTFMKVVRALSPGVVLMENVPDMVLWEQGQTIREICGALERLGYRVQARVLECWRLGVPQHRRRLFVVACKPGLRYRWPEPSGPPPTVRDAIGDLPSVGPAHRNYWIPYGGPPFTELQRRLRDGSTMLSDHITRDVRPDDRQAFGRLKDGARYADLPDELRRYRADIFRDKYHVLSWDGLSRSMTSHLAKDGYWYIHPGGRRMLSIREAARLQTFPDWFRFAGYPTDRFRQIGNAVPVEVARRLGEGIVAAMNSRSTDGTAPFRATDFRRRLLAWHRRRGRHYPWRLADDPWLVLAAEMLLRRTRSDAVARVWPEFQSRFPTPHDVVRRPAELGQLLHPLGLRWRVNNLLDLARRLVAEWGGRVPIAREDLIMLPGVGNYVADAVRVFALGERAVLVDSNTARIATRVFGMPSRWTSLRSLDLRAAVARLGGARPPTPKVNLALLDLGGTICLPARPLCDQCPVRKLCCYANERVSSPRRAPE